MMLSKALWYARRLQAMSLPEVWYRLRQRAIIEQERLKKPGHGKFLKEGKNTLDAWADFQAERDVHFFFSWDDRVTIKHLYEERFPSNLLAMLNTAPLLLQHNICIFGHHFALGPQIAWQRDPLTGRDWPAVYWADIDIRNGQIIGGVKWVWELNRHYHLVSLGKAYFLTGDEQYAQEVCNQIVHWIHCNPPRTGVNWTSSLELAVRLINWTWALAFVRRSPALTSELFGTIIRSVAEQASHILRHLSAYSSANNHLIGEAAGLAIIGLSFPYLFEADRWRDIGLRILAQELERQIYPDGTPAEQSIHYLSFVLDFNLLAWRLAELNSLPVPSIWYDRFAAACDFIQHIMDERGYVPAIGDSDNGWVIRLDDRPDVNNYRSILATAAALLQRPDLKANAGGWDEKSYWLLGTEGGGVFEGLKPEPQDLPSRFFPNGGYYVMRVSKRLIIMDCGPLGYLSTAAHGHADALQLTMSIEGQPIIVDPGTYAYQEGGRYRDFFRSTAAHNTVVIDGQDQSEMVGTFLWGRKAKARLIRQVSTPNYDLCIAEHDGYTKLGVVHRRSVLFLHKTDWMLVADHLIGQGEHSFEQLWHLPAESYVQIRDSYIQITIGQTQIFAVPFPSFWGEIHVYCGGTEPIQGWISYHYGHKEAAPVVSMKGRSRLPVRLITGFLLRPLPEMVDSIPSTLSMLVDILERLGGEDI